MRSAAKRAALLATMLTLSAQAISQSAPTLTSRPMVIAYLAAGRMPENGLRIAGIPAERLTHIFYAFGEVADNGLAALSDPCRDAGECQIGDEPDTLGGNFAELMALKQHHPHVQVLISLGGSAKNFVKVAASTETRERFVASCINLFILKYPGLFDGIDIDWEFPLLEDRENFSLLMAEFRHQLDAQPAPPRGRYALSIAVSAEPLLMRHLDLRRLTEAVDWINVMTYDFHAGSDIAHFNAPLFTAPGDPTPELNVDASMQAFLKAGVPASKLVLGVPFYGRSYAQVASPNNGLFQAGDPEGTLIDYRVLMDEPLENRGFTRFWHEEAQVPWLYNPKSRAWITYDDPESIARKAAYAQTHRLGGVMFWELGADDGSLLKAIQRGLGF